MDSGAFLSSAAEAHGFLQQPWPGHPQPARSKIPDTAFWHRCPMCSHPSCHPLPWLKQSLCDHAAYVTLSAFEDGPDGNPVTWAGEALFVFLPLGVRTIRPSPRSCLCFHSLLVTTSDLPAFNSIHMRKIPEPVPVSPPQTSLWNPRLLRLPAFFPPPRGCVTDSSRSGRSKPST